MYVSIIGRIAVIGDWLCYSGRGFGIKGHIVVLGDILVLGDWSCCSLNYLLYYLWGGMASLALIIIYLFFNSNFTVMSTFMCFYTKN
jgi:hypothetical protein